MWLLLHGEAAVLFYFIFVVVVVVFSLQDDHW